MVSGHAYPWDVVGDPAFLDRATETVTLATAYHSTRAATPLHPVHQLVDARHAALYRPVRGAAWTGHRLSPRPAEWMTVTDPAGEAAALLKNSGRRVIAWIVLTHNTRLGTERPDVAVVNCFGETYPYALCPAHAEVRDYAATLAAEAVREQQTPVAYLAALLEAEHQERAERRERRRLIDARFPALKRLEDFRFADNPKIPQATLAALAEGSWISDRESVIFIGDSGTGKTHCESA
jgi:hypothetical protein